MKLSEQIKASRKAAGLTQEQVANYLGVTPPAVNKWEKGNSYPDITLLPALARLLRIDMNQLFSFREELTQQEIGQFVNELSQMTAQGKLEQAFDLAAEKIREYPRCDLLIHTTATILNGALLMADLEEEKMARYDQQIMDWLERSANGRDPQASMAATYVLASKYIQREEYDNAERMLEKLPDAPVDTTLLRTSIVAYREGKDAAAAFLEGKLMKMFPSIQGYLYKLMDLEEQTHHPEMAEAIGEIASQMPQLWGSGPYMQIIPQLSLAGYRRDTETCLQLIRKILELSKQPWDMTQSPLFYRLTAVKPQADMSSVLVSSFRSCLEGKGEHAFLEGNEQLRKILEEYGG